MGTHALNFELTAIAIVACCAVAWVADTLLRRYNLAPWIYRQYLRNPPDPTMAEPSQTPDSKPVMYDVLVHLGIDGNYRAQAIFETLQPLSATLIHGIRREEVSHSQTSPLSRSISPPRLVRKTSATIAAPMPSTTSLPPSALFVATMITLPSQRHNMEETHLPEIAVGYTEVPWRYDHGQLFC